MKKLKLILMAALVTVPAAAFAQQPSPPPQTPDFVPYTMDVQTHNAIFQFLNDAPARWAMPVMNTLNQLELAAVARERAANEKKAKTPAEAAAEAKKKTEEEAKPKGKE